MIGAIALLVSCSVMSAQTPNLVLNGSFEKTSRHVHGYGDARFADSVSSSNNTTVDLYGADACGKDFDIPSNYMGTQGSKEGNNYIGIIAYMADDAGLFKTKPGYRKYSEYVQMTLAEPMIAGKSYVITFSASLAEKSAYAVSGLGVYFTKSKMDVKNNSFLNVTPHIVATDIISGTEWTTFTGTYVATGGERYVTLGCFDRYMDVQKIVAPNTNNSRKAYYYIDDVNVVPAVIPDKDMLTVLSGSCYRLENLNFETDKAVILPASFDELNALAHFLKTYPYLVVYVDGHTDKVGTDEHNEQLSVDRANAVKAYLTSKGIAEDRLKVRGYGESQPIEMTNDPSFANRRVEITICAVMK